MHEHKERHSRKACSFRTWLLAPVIQEVIRAKEEILCALKTHNNQLEPGEITKAFGPVTDVINKMAR